MPKVTIHNSAELGALTSVLASKNEYPLNISYSTAGNRTISQNKLQHSVYAELSRYLIAKGRTDCTAKWMKQMLKNKFLGWVSESFTDISTGEKFTKEVLRHTADLDKGEAGHYTTQIIEWAESIGCQIKIPANSCHMKFLEQQNG